MEDFVFSQFLSLSAKVPFCALPVGKAGLLFAALSYVRSPGTQFWPCQMQHP